MAKLENKLKSEKIKIGILGGTFDPAHKGHLEISKQAKKRFGLKNITWAITKQNPLKDESKSNLKSRIQFAKKIIGKNKYIKVNNGSHIMIINKYKWFNENLPKLLLA